METYCVRCKKYTKIINPRFSGTSSGEAMILSKWATCGSKKSRFIKNQEAKGILINLGLRTPLSKVPILGDEFMIKIHLKQLGFTYSVCGPFTKNKEKI